MISRRPKLLRALFAGALAGVLTSCTEPLAERAVCEGGDGEVSLAWQALPGIDTYRVFRANDGMNAEPIGEVAGASFVDTGVQNGTRYGYIVRAVVPEGVEVSDVAACAVTPVGGEPTDVASVADLTCRAKSGKVDLAWTPVDGAVSYRVLRATPAAEFEQLGEIQAPPYVDATVMDGTSYQFAVVSVAPDGRAAAPSIACSARPGAIGGGDPPPAVSGLQCRGKRDKLDVSWTSVAGAAYYRVYRSVGGVATAAGEVANTTFADFGLPVGVEHLYAVRAVAADGTESADSTACAYTPADRDGGNRAPQISSPPLTSALERSRYEYDVVATDPEGDAITLSTTQAPPGMYFEETTEGTTSRLVWIPVAEQIGPHTVELRATDTRGAFSTQAFVVTAADLNEAPRITSVPDPRAQVGELYQYDVEAFDPEQAAVTYSFAEPAPAGMGIDPATGVISWTPSAPALALTVQVRAADAGGAFDTQSFQLDATRDPLVLSAPAGEFEVRVGDTLELRFVSNYAGSRFLARPLPANATQEGDLFRFTPAPGQAGRYELIFKTVFSDLKASQRVAITVIDPNQAPVVGALGPFTVAEGGTLRFAVGATDPDGDALAVTAPALALENAFFDEFSNELVFTPSFEQAGSYEVAFQVDDGVATTSALAAITVTDAVAPIGDLDLVVDPPQSPTFVRSQSISGSVTGEVASATAPAAALVTGLSPTNAQQGRTATIAITGRNTHFVQGETTATFGDGITVDVFTVTSPTAATASVTVSPTAPLGIRQMRVRSDGQEIPSVVAFRVEAGAAVVRGVLRDEFTGEPLVGARVTINGSNASAVTGADGSFEIAGVPSGAQTLIAVVPNFELLELAITVEENATYQLEQPIGLDALARPARPGGSLPRAQTLASVIDRGVSSIGEPISKEQAVLLITDTMIAVGVNQLGVLDESGGQMNPRIIGTGLLSLTPSSVDAFAERLARGEVYTLRQVAFALTGSFGWVFEGLELESIVYDLQRSANAAWQNTSNPDYALAIAIFNQGTSLSSTPPVITADTRFNSFQAFLLFTSFVVRHFPVLDMAFDLKLEQLGIDPRELLEDAGVDADRYAALAPHQRPGGGAITQLAERASDWAEFAGDLAFGGAAQAQTSGGGESQGFGGFSGGVINVFSWRTLSAAVYSGAAGVLIAGGIVLALAVCGIVGPLAGFAVLGTFLVGAATTVFAKFIGGVLEDRDLPRNLTPRPPAAISQVADPTVEDRNFFLRFQRSSNDLESDRLRRENPDLGPNWIPDVSGWVQDGWDYLDGTVDKRLLDHRYVLWRFPCNPDEARCRNLQLDSIAGRKPFARNSSLAHLSAADIAAEPLLQHAPGVVDGRKAHGGEFEQFRIAKRDLDVGDNYFKIQTLQFYRRIWTLDNEPDRDLWVTKPEVGIIPPPPTTATGIAEAFRGNALQEFNRLLVETPATFADRVRDGKVAQLERMRILAQQRAALAQQNRLGFTIGGEKWAEVAAQEAEADAKKALDDLKARIAPARARIEAHGELGTRAVEYISEEGVSRRTAEEVRAELLDPNTPRGQRLNALLDAGPPDARFQFNRFVEVMLSEQRVQNGVAQHSDAIADLRGIKENLIARFGPDGANNISFFERTTPGRLDFGFDGTTVNRPATPRTITFSSADTLDEARAAIDAEIDFQQRQVNNLTRIQHDPTHPLNVTRRGRINSFQRSFFDPTQYADDIANVQLAEQKFKTTQEIVQLQRDVASADARVAEVNVRGFDPTAPKGFAGVRQGYEARVQLRDVNSGWNGVKGSFGVDAGNITGIAVEVGTEIHALRDDIDVLASDLSSTIVVTAVDLGPDPLTHLPRIEVTSSPTPQANSGGGGSAHLGVGALPIASRFGEKPEPELPRYARGLARGPLAQFFRAPMAIDDAGNPVLPDGSRLPRLTRPAQFTGPGGAPIQFETDPDLGQALGVLYPAGPPPENPRTGYLFRDFPFSPPEAERFEAGFPSELIAVDSKGRVYLENFNSNEEFGGRIFRFEGMPPQREHVGSVNYFSQTLMYANPVFPIAMEIGDARDPQDAIVEDLFIVNKDLGVYFDSGRAAVNRVLRLYLHQLDQLPGYANGQNRNRLVAQPWASHEDFRFDGPTDLVSDSRPSTTFEGGKRPMYMSDLDSLYVLRDVDDNATAEVAKIAEVSGRTFSGIASDQNGNLYVADYGTGELYLIPQQLLDDIVAGRQPLFSSNEDLDARAFLIKVDLDRPGDVELDSFEHRYIVSTPGGLVPFDIPAVGRLPAGIGEIRVDALGTELPVTFRRDRGNLFEVGANSEGTFAGKILRIRVERIDEESGESVWTANAIRTQLFGATVLRDDALEQQD